MPDHLEVRRQGVVVAELRRDRPGRVACHYTPEVVHDVEGGAPLISCALPVSRGKLDATAWCRGLLPEGRHLHALAARADVAASDTFALLARYGRDIAGVFEICRPDDGTRTPDVELYTAESLAAEIDELDQNPLGLHDDSELSLAGLQDKLVVVATGDGWARPRHGYPSTHIIKLDHPTHEGLIDAEAACMSLAKEVGLTDVDLVLDQIGGRRVLVLSRFDRELSPAGVERLHQEDLLQALGLSPDDRFGRAKYQVPGTPGPPSWWHLAELLGSYALDLSSELVRLLRAMVFTTLVGNADCHAKNLALLHDDASNVALAPLYDTVPTALWPQLRADTALSVADHHSGIGFDELVQEAIRWRISPRRAEAVVRDFAAELAEAADVSGHADVTRLVRMNAAQLRG